MSKANKVITFHYTLKNQKGDLLDSSRDAEPLAFLEGSGQIITGLEKELLNMNTGETRKITVAADEAYGTHNEELIIQVPRDRFPPDDSIQVGDQFRLGQGADGEESPVFLVKNVTDAWVQLDGNHPLAGQDLFFDVEIMETRPATDEEMSHGHAHGAHGHHH